MKTLFWIVGVIAGIVLLVIAGLSIFIHIYLKSDRLKAIIIPRIETATGRKAEIRDIKVSLFKGIIVDGFQIKEKDGTTNFVKAGEFNLKYNLLPLLHRQLVIQSVSLVDPSIKVVRYKDGTYNFTDIQEKMKAEKGKPAPPAPEEKKKGLPLAIAANKINIQNARLDFTDQEKTLPDVSALCNVDLKLSYGQQGAGPAALKYSGTLDIKSLRASMQGVQTETSGKIELGDAINLKLTTSIEKNVIKTAGVIRNYRTTPDITLDISSPELNLDRLMALMPAKSTTAPAPKPKEKAGPGMAQKMTAAGKITVGRALMKGYQINNFSLTYKYVRGTMTINPISAGISGGDKAQVQGTFNGNLGFQYTSAPGSIMDTLKGLGNLNLTKIVMKPTKMTEQVASLTGIEMLRSPSFNSGQFKFDIANKIVGIDGLLDSPDLKVQPIKGNVGFNKGLAMKFDVQLSPNLSTRVPGKGVTRYLKNEQGWTVFPFVASGTTSSPSVSLNKAALGKGVQKGLEKELEKGLLKKLGPKQEGGKEPGPGDLLKGIFK